MSPARVRQQETRAKRLRLSQTPGGGGGVGEGGEAGDGEGREEGGWCGWTDLPEPNYACSL